MQEYGLMLRPKDVRYLPYKAEYDAVITHLTSLL